MDLWEIGISILESISNLDGIIDKEKVRETVGLPSMEKMIKILGAILTGDVNTTLRLSNELMDQGKEPQSYISELLKLLETIYLKENGLLDIYSKEEQNLLKKYMDLDKLEVYKVIKEILNIISIMKNMENKRVMLIAALLNLTQSNNKNSINSNSTFKKNDVNLNIINNNNINRSIINTDKKTEVEGKEQIKNIKDNNKEIKEEQKDLNINTKREKIDILAIRKYMLTNKEMKLFVMLNNVDIFIENDKAYVEVKTNLSEEILSNENIIKISNAIKSITGKEYIVEYISKK